jgi:hypothetical protein
MYSMRTGPSPVDINRHLMNVAIRCRDAPVLLLGTHADVVHAGSGLSLAALKMRFPQVGDWVGHLFFYYSLDCRTNMLTGGWDELMAMVLCRS